MNREKVTALENPRFELRLNELSRVSDVTWLLASSVGLGFTLIAAYAFPFSSSGKFWAYAGLLIRAALYLWAGDAYPRRGGATLAQLFKVGMVAGIFELLVDWGLIHWISHGQLVYLTGNDVVLLGSPIWMPLAWACVIVELGYPALRLFSIFKEKMARRKAALVSSLIAATGAGLTVGFYEYFAFRANWWKYEKANVMIGDFCALYIPLGELLMFLPLLWIAASALSDERSWASALIGGTRFAACIAIGYGLAYLALEAGRTI